MTRTPSTEQEDYRFMRLEAEADMRPHTGPCLLCGVYQPILFAGRRGGLRVYCDLCAIASRTDSLRGRKQ